MFFTFYDQEIAQIIPTVAKKKEIQKEILCNAVKNFLKNNIYT